MGSLIFPKLILSFARDAIVNLFTGRRAHADGFAPNNTRQVLPDRENLPFQPLNCSADQRGAKCPNWINGSVETRRR